MFKYMHTCTVLLQVVGTSYILISSVDDFSLGADVMKRS